MKGDILNYKQNKSILPKIITFLVFYIVFLILVFRFAPALASGGLPAFFRELGDLKFSNILDLTFDLKYFLIGSMLYILIFALIEMSNRNLRLKDAYGSASWGNIRNLNLKFKDKKEYETSFYLIIYGWY